MNSRRPLSASFYVDKALFLRGTLLFCHLITDGDREALHSFAEEIGVRRCWYHARPFPHYDLNPENREKAIEGGAGEVSLRELLRIVKAANSGR
jgi:hypothetical protein